LPQDELAVEFITMKFSAMSVSIEPPKHGLIEVDVSYTLVNRPGEISPPPELMSIETLTFAAKRHNIEQLNGLRASAVEVEAWLTSRGKTWEDWNAREYLEHRMDAALPSG
jgi:hypothetical protein